jgi:hypothetical protein
MRTALFWVIMLRVVIIPCRRFRTTYRVLFSRVKKSKSLHFLSLDGGPIGCPETSVRNYRYFLRKNPEQRSSHVLDGGSLRSDVRVLWLYVLVRSFHDASWQYSVTPATKTGPNTKMTLTRTLRTD